MQSSNTRLRLLTILVICLSMVLIGCSFEKKPINQSGSTSSSSRLLSTTNVENFFRCNEIENSHIEGTLTLYYSQYGEADDEAIRLYIEDVTDAFEENSEFYFQFYRWKASDNGTTFLDQDPVEFRIELVNNQFVPITGYYTQLNYENLKIIAAKHGLVYSSARELLEQLTFVLTDMDAEYDALKIASYDGAEGGQVQKEIDALIPAFATHPDEYDDTHPRVLTQLHPFDSRSGDGWSITDLQAEAEKKCPANFAGGLLSNQFF